MSTPRETMELLEEASSKYERAKALHDEQDFSGAVELLQEALKTHETVLGKYHKTTIKTYWRLGRSQLRTEDGVPAALVAFKRAIRTCELSYGKEHLATKTLYEDISTCLDEVSGSKDDHDVGTSSSHSSSSGDDIDATKPDSRRSNAANSTASSTTTVDKDDYMRKIARWLEHEQEGDQMCNRRKYPQAIQNYTQAIDMEKKVFGGVNNMDCADIMCKLACLYRIQEDLAKSEELYKDALVMFEATLGEDHPATRGAASHLRNLNQKPGQAKAKAWWGKTSDSFRRKQLDVEG